MRELPDETVHAPYGPLPEGGTVRPITRWGTPVMHRPQQPVSAHDDALRSLAADMVATMYAADGVGLAACQIGEDVALFVFDCPDDSGRRTVGVVCNPEVSTPVGPERQLDVGDEGCLSFPGAFVECARPDRATVTGTGLDGEPVTFTGDGLLARCLQHETDHTRGTVFGDRLPTKLRKKLQKAHDRAAEEFPADWPA
jgi:peptide deformylase